MSVELLFWIIIGILILDYVVERILEIADGTSRTAPIPTEIADIYDVETYNKQQKYEQAKSRINFIASTLSFLFILVLFLCGGFGILDRWITSTFSCNFIFSGLLFFGILYFISDIITIPLEWYNTFVIEQRFGFNKMTKATFVFDKLKSWLVTIVFGGSILAGLFWLISFFDQNFWIIAWIAISIILVLINMFYSTVFVPLFNKQTPLEEGELKTAIFDFSNKVGFKLDNIYVIDGSKRSTKANAYFSGLGPKKRIVLYDTLIQNMTVSEIVAVLAHEIGHYKKRHTIQMLVASVLQMGLILFLFGLFISEHAFTEVLGIEFTSDKIYASLYVFSILFTPISFFIGIVVNILSRKNEYEADKFSGENYSSLELENALKKLTRQSLSNLTPHPWSVFCYYSHPTLYQRVVALRKINRNDNER